MKQSLFNISNDLERLFDSIEENGGEVTDEILKELEVTNENLKEKLNEYRKVLFKYENDINSCKTEKSRIDSIVKTRKNVVERLKTCMIDALNKFGQTGKNGNKYIELVDSKLFTKTTKSVSINERAAGYLFSSLVTFLKQLYETDYFYNTDSISEEKLVAGINAALKDKYPNEYENMMTELGHAFTIEDIRTFTISINQTLRISDLGKVVNFNIINAWMNNYEETDTLPTYDKSFIKAILEKEKLSYASICENQSLTIK